MPGASRPRRTGGGCPWPRYDAAPVTEPSAVLRQAGVPLAPLSGARTVVEVLRAAAESFGDEEAYVEPAPAGAAHVEPAPAGAADVGPAPAGTTGPAGRRSLTFGQWDLAAGGAAGLLQRMGVGKGDVVCLLLPSSVDYAVAYAAALRLGAVTSGVNPRLGAAEVASIVARTAPVVTVVDPELGLQLPGGCGRILERAELRGSGTGPAPRRLPALHEDDPVAVVWTSGTTGRPKGAVFDHANLAAVAAGTDVLSRPGDRRLSPLPFAHVGYMTRPWDEIAHRVTTVITPTPWRAADALAIMVRERVTVGQGVPTQWSLLLDLPELEHADLSALRIVGTGAARVPAELVAELRRRLGVPVVVRYTSTETSLGTGTRPDDPDEVVASSVGRPVPGVELQLTDEGGRPVPAHEIGRVRLRSGACMRGYWADAAARTAVPAASPHDVPGGGAADRPGEPGAGEPRWAPYVDAEATAGVRTPDGWIVTGDYGSLTESGDLRLAGRANDLYIRGGYNVFPAEVEDVVASHPAVARVAVVGAPDPVLGEVGVAVVELVPGAGEPPGIEALRALCRGVLADYKAPDALVVVGELPLTPMMKVDRRALGELAAEAARSRSRSGAGPARASMVADHIEEEAP